MMTKYCVDTEERKSYRWWCRLKEERVSRADTPLPSPKELFTSPREPPPSQARSPKLITYRPCNLPSSSHPHHRPPSPLHQAMGGTSAIMKRDKEWQEVLGGKDDTATPSLPSFSVLVLIACPPRCGLMRRRCSPSRHDHE